MAVDITAVARVLGVTTNFKDLRGGAAALPMRIAVIAQGATLATYSTTKFQAFSALQVAETLGFGSPAHLIVQRLLPSNGDGVGSIPVTVYPLEDDGAGVAAAGDITPVGVPAATGSFRVRINNIVSAAFLVEVGDSVADIVTAMTDAINAQLDEPMIAVDNATQVDLTAKWKGETGNDLYIEIEGPTDIGVTFAITQPVGGLTNPDVQPALDQVGNIWETMIISGMNIEDTATLDKYSTFNEGRWGTLVRKPLVAFTGATPADVATAIAVPDARKTDRTNVQLVEPGGVDLPFVVAARQVARIAVVANSKPANDYGSQPATGLVPGADGVQWNYAQRDAAVKGGSSTVEVKDGVVNVSDTVTFYHPSGDPTPAYRFVKDIIKLMNVIFNLDVVYSRPEWDGAPLIPDDQATTNPDAKQPKMATAATAAVIDALALNAILSNPAATKESIVSAISEVNPNRLDQTVTVQLSGNTNIISVDLSFGFFFGG